MTKTQALKKIDIAINKLEDVLTDGITGASVADVERVLDTLYSLYAKVETAS